MHALQSPGSAACWEAMGPNCARTQWPAHHATTVTVRFNIATAATQQWSAELVAFPHLCDACCKSTCLAACNTPLPACLPAMPSRRPQQRPPPVPQCHKQLAGSTQLKQPPARWRSSPCFQHCTMLGSFGHGQRLTRSMVLAATLSLASMQGSQAVLLQPRDMPGIALELCPDFRIRYDKV